MVSERKGPTFSRHNVGIRGAPLPHVFLVLPIVDAVGGRERKGVDVLRRTISVLIAV